MPADIGNLARQRVGTMIRGKYRLDAVLGAGGMAIVYKATHRNQKEFAIKMLRAEVSSDEELRRRFLREGYAANSVKHPGVVSILDDDVDEQGCAFLVMELLDGHSVDDILGSLGGSMPGPPACAIIVQLLDVLAAAHTNGILHRDIKPANVFLTKAGEVKVLDFGIARVRDAASGIQTTATGAAYGTPAFMSPEQALGKTKEADARSDVWQCGAALFTMLTGQFVHLGETPQHILVLAATQPARPIASVIPALPEPLAAAIDRALAFDKEKRFATAAEFRDALVKACNDVFGAVLDQAGLAAFLRGLPAAMQETRRQEAAVGATTARPVSSDKRFVTSRVPLAAFLVAGGVALLAFVAVIAVTLRNRGEQASPAPTATTTVTATITTAIAPSTQTQTTASVATTAETPPTPTTSTSARQTAPIRQTTRPAIVPPPSASIVKPSCTPNYWIDPEGNKHFKPECFE